MELCTSFPFKQPCVTYLMKSCFDRNVIVETKLLLISTAAIGSKFQLTLIQKRPGRDIYQSLAHNVRNMNPVDAILASWDEMSDGGLK